MYKEIFMKYLYLLRINKENLWNFLKLIDFKILLKKKLMRENRVRTEIINITENFFIVLLLFFDYKKYVFYGRCIFFKDKYRFIKNRVVI
jgi:hypothetical protein